MSSLQLLEHAGVEFCGGFARKGDGEHFVRVRDGVTRKQLEVALHQQAGLSRTRGRFDNPGGGGVECAKPLCLVGSLF